MSRESKESKESKESIESKGKILLVDDSQINRMVISKYIQQYNFQVVEMVNGKNALNYLKTDNLILMIFVDVQMPVLNGIDMTYQLRKDEFQIPIVGITGYADEDTIKLCLDAGMNKVLCKPITKARLCEVIDEFIKPENA